MILALKTDGAVTGMLLINDADRKHVQWDSGRKLSDELLGRIEGFMNDNAASLTDLTGIIIFSGPGSFTSLRIGHTVANALADGLNIAVIGAEGEDWLDQGIKVLPSTAPGHPALPFYGADANITKPKH